jgi:MFS superfamily sulfate permease-like transporter
MPSSSTPETVPFIDLTAAQMLADLRRDLTRDGVRLLLARDVGQVRDVLRRAETPDLVEHVHPTVGGRRRPGAVRPGSPASGDPPGCGCRETAVPWDR